MLTGRRTGNRFRRLCSTTLSTMQKYGPGGRAGEILFKAGEFCLRLHLWMTAVRFSTRGWRLRFREAGSS